MAKKRGNNEGTIYKRSNGTWRAQVVLEGRRLSKTTKTKQEAQNWLRKTQDEVFAGLTYESTTIDLPTFLEEWLISAKPTLRYNTFHQYNQIIHKYILPRLGNRKLRELKPILIQQLYNHMVAEGYDFRTVQMVHGVIHVALVQAVKLGLLQNNPDDATTPPKPIPKEMKFLDETQVQQLLITAKAQGSRFYALYHLAIATGMRQGELLGLKWSDMDWGNQTLTVSRSLSQLKTGEYVFNPPKTKAGRRQIDLGTVSTEVLRAHHRSQYLESVSQPGWNAEDLIFPSKTGKPMDPGNLRRMYKNLLKSAGLPNIRFHDLRHTAATLMLNNGIPVLIVSRRLGHAKPSITLDIYGHLIPGQQKVVASLMDELLTPIQLMIEN